MSKIYSIEPGIQDPDELVDVIAQLLRKAPGGMLIGLKNIVVEIIYGEEDHTLLADKFLAMIGADGKNKHVIAAVFTAYRIVEGNVNNFVPFWMAWREVSPDHQQSFFLNGPKGGRLATILIQNFGTEVIASQVREFICDQTKWFLHSTRYK